MDALSAAGCRAMGVGERDLGLGLEWLRRLDKRAKFPFIASNLVSKDDGKPVFAESSRIEAGGFHFGILSLMGSSAAAEQDESLGQQQINAALERSNLALAPPIEVARRVVAALRAQGADTILVLSHLGSDGNKALVEAVDGIDFVFGAHQLEVRTGELGPRTFELDPGALGLSVVEVLLHHGSEKGGGLFTKEIQAKVHKAESLRLRAQGQFKRYRDYVKAGGDPESPGLRSLGDATVRRMDSVLDLDRELRGKRYYVTDLPTVLPEGPSFTAVEAPLGDYRASLATLNAKLPPAGPPGDEARRVAGSAACESCHKNQHAVWADSPHAHAWQGLQRKEAESNLECIGCHSTGFREGGFDQLAARKGWDHVGCESCHGPGLAHVLAKGGSPEDRKITRIVALETCKGCHTRQDSPQFDYAIYLQKIVVPGHGLPVPGQPDPEPDPTPNPEPKPAQ